MTKKNDKQRRPGSWGRDIQPETLEHLLALLREKTAYPHRVAVEIVTGAVVKTVDNEDDAQETIRRLLSLPGSVAPHQLHTEIAAPAQRVPTTATQRALAEAVAIADELNVTSEQVSQRLARRRDELVKLKAREGGTARQVAARNALILIRQTDLVGLEALREAIEPTRS